MKFQSPIIFLFFVCSLHTSCSQVQSSGKSFSDEAVYFSKTLAAKHPDLFKKVTKRDFDSLVTDLKTIANSLPPEKFLVELCKINARIADEHTRIEPDYQSVLPVRFDWFDEGLVIVATDSIYKNCLGARVLLINNHPAEEAIRRFSFLLKNDNASFQKYWIASYFNKPIFLKGLDLIIDNRMVSYKLLTPQGDTLTQIIRALATGQPIVKVVSAPMKGLLPYKKDNSYWYEFDSATNILYFNYAKCQVDENLPFDRFNDQLFEEIKLKNPAKLIVDLRFNGGGNSAVLNPFLKSIKKSYLNQNGKLFVIIGRKTASSALMNALTLVKETNCITVGEPTGANINHFGELKSFKLSYAGFTIYYSTRFWENWAGHNGALMPDVAVTHSLANFLNNNDEALDYIQRQ